MNHVRTISNLSLLGVILFALNVFLGCSEQAPPVAPAKEVSEEEDEEMDFDMEWD